MKQATRQAAKPGGKGHVHFVGQPAPQQDFAEQYEKRDRGKNVLVLNTPDDAAQRFDHRPANRGDSADDAHSGHDYCNRDADQQDAQGNDERNADCRDAHARLHPAAMGTLPVGKVLELLGNFFARFLGTVDAIEFVVPARHQEICGAQRQ